VYSSERMVVQVADAIRKSRLAHGWELAVPAGASLKEKRALLGGNISAASERRLERYGRASFAGTASEYVHCLWHDVKVVSGPEHLPAQQLRRRLELLSGWFPPGRGHKLFPPPE
jgi:hypothetical protein